MEDMKIRLLDKFSTDSVVRQYLDGVYEAEMKPVMTAIIGEGKQQGYVNRDLPGDRVVLSLNMMKAGGTACGGDLQRIAGDSRVMAALIRVSCYASSRRNSALPLISIRIRRQHESGHHR